MGYTATVHNLCSIILRVLNFEAAEDLYLAMYFVNGQQPVEDILQVDRPNCLCLAGSCREGNQSL